MRHQFLAVLASLFLVVLVAIDAYSEDEKYLEVKPDGWLATVEGDGTEAGFEVRFRYPPGASEEHPTVDIPAADNSASCKVEEVGVSIPPEDDQYADHVFVDVRIRTAVNADTGSCLVWIRKATGETAAVIAYAYAV